MSKVRCRGPATACSAKFVVDGNMQKLGGKGTIKPTVEAYFRSPSGRVTKRNVKLRTQGRRNQAVALLGRRAGAAAVGARVAPSSTGRSSRCGWARPWCSATRS